MWCIFRPISSFKQTWPIKVRQSHCQASSVISCHTVAAKLRGFRIVLMLAGHPAACPNVSYHLTAQHVSTKPKCSINKDRNVSDKVWHNPGFHPGIRIPQQSGMLSPLPWKRWEHREYYKLCLHAKKRLPIGAADQATVTKATVLTILCKATNDPAHLISRRLALKNGGCILNCLDAKKALRRPKSPKINTHLTSKKRLSFKWGYFLRFVVSSIKLVGVGISASGYR